ncbi:MAG: acetyl-CoA decarbonylase/synthase complex subunit gamma [Candidatus Heimdallarchaeota archaeon]|nr:acetyl-CoA decarbonylase/synthase complex subunit gamma [Candidatus Heimdallarchaeota archaeon]
MSGTLEYYKLLPKTNCGECGLPTCLAFALQLSQNNIQAVKCPHLSEELKKQLVESSLPPVREVIIGNEANKVHLGGETVLYRHEKKFNNEPVICIAISDLDSNESIERKLQNKTIERLAEKLSTNMIALFNDSGKCEPFLELVKNVVSIYTKPICLFSEQIDHLEEALASITNSQTIIGYAKEENIYRVLEIARKYNSAVVLSSDNGTIGGLRQLISIAKEKGFTELILDCSGKNIFDTIQNQIIVRWNAIKGKDSFLGFPIISFPSKYLQNEFALEIINAGVLTSKYSSIIVLSDNDINHLIPLLVLRQNIYTDPQKPIQVDEGLYSLGKVDENSPVFLTTNFSLTYFTVSNDIESMRQPSYLLVIDTEGTSVLTAYAAEKISARKIAQAIDKTKLTTKVVHNTIIIPGFLSPMSSEIEEATSWKVLIGPIDSAEISLYMNKYWRTN